METEIASVIDMENGTYWLSIKTMDGETIVNIGAGSESKSLVTSIVKRINSQVAALVADAREEERAKLWSVKSWS